MERYEKEGRKRRKRRGERKDRKRRRKGVRERRVEIEKGRD